jgi:putative flippase GtrA
MPEDVTTTVELPSSTSRPAPGPARWRAVLESPGCARIRHGVRKPHNWVQLIRFAAVGASGYVVNLGVFAACVHALGIDYRIASVISFIVAVMNNFWFNRHWTFDARHEHPAFQAVRFFTVSLITFAFTYIVLVALVSGAGFSKVVAQAIAIVAGTPLSFIGQKLWSFRV